LAKPRGQNVGRCNRVLDGEIDADAEGGGHRVGRVANAEEAWPVPASQAIDLDGEQLDVVPRPQVADSVAQKGRQAHDVVAEGLEAPLPYLLRPGPGIGHADGKRLK
jgi:hypothetical protein